MTPSPSPAPPAEIAEQPDSRSVYSGSSASSGTVQTAKHTPMAIAAARALSDRHALVCNVNAGDVWALYGQDSIEDAEVALKAAGVAELIRELKHAAHWFDQLTPVDAERYRAAIAKATGSHHVGSDAVIDLCRIPGRRLCSEKKAGRMKIQPWDAEHYDTPLFAQGIEQPALSQRVAPISDERIEAIAGTDELTGDAIIRFARALLAEAVQPSSEEPGAAGMALAIKEHREKHARAAGVQPFPAPKDGFTDEQLRALFTLEQPVAWRYRYKALECAWHYTDKKSEADDARTVQDIRGGNAYEVEALAPAALPAVQPLTDEQVEPLFRQVRDMPVVGTKDEWFWFAWGVEMGERAHGIRPESALPAGDVAAPPGVNACDKPVTGEPK